MTVSEHQKFLETFAKSRDFDEIDELAANPIVERIPRRSEADQRRLHAILDELEREERP